MALYLLHAKEPLLRAGTHGAQHYLGYSDDTRVLVRVYEHLTGHSHVSFLQAFHERNIPLYCVAIWAGATRDDERKVKHGGRIRDYCPLCNDMPASPPGWEFLPCPVLVEVSSSQPWRRRNNRNIGVWSAISQTVNAGSFPRVQMLARITSSHETLQSRGMIPGGNTSSATALPGPSTTEPSASTKPQSPSGSSALDIRTGFSETYPATKAHPWKAERAVDWAERKREHEQAQS
jgi:hypothetical protein